MTIFNFLTTLHITKVLAYFLKQHNIYAENCSNFLSDFGKTFAANRIYPFFPEAENLFDILTCYARTSMALVRSKYIKLCWKLQWEM